MSMHHRDRLAHWRGFRAAPLNRRWPKPRRPFTPAHGLVLIAGLALAIAGLAHLWSVT